MAQGKPSVYPVIELNGNLVLRQHYGYSPFIADLTPYIKHGKKNRLAVTVNNSAQPSERWYSGSGLYRHVSLLVGGKVRIAPWGVYAYTDNAVLGDAVVVVETDIINETAEDKILHTDIRIINEAGDISAAGRGVAHVPKMGNGKTRARIVIENAELWDIDNPHLYTIEVSLSEDDKPLDDHSITFGARTVTIDTKNGFMLNGRSIKLKGGCVHHDNGILGSVSLYDAEFRKMKLHKQFDAPEVWRDKHVQFEFEGVYSQAMVFINDGYAGQWAFGYSEFIIDADNFLLYGKQNTIKVVARTGDRVMELMAERMKEIAEAGGDINATMTNLGDGMDMASQIPEVASATEETFSTVDIAGYNYMVGRYVMDHETYGRSECVGRLHC